MSLHRSLILSLLRSAGREVVTDDRRSYRGIDMLVGAAHIADAIESQTGKDTVGLLLPTSGVFPMAALAAWSLGKAIVPLNYLLKPDELQYVIDDSGIDTILTAQPLLDHLGCNPRVRSLVRLEEINFRSPPAPRLPVSRGLDDLACLLYTSGTSGKPKGVMLSHGNLLANYRQIRGWIDFGPRDVILGVLPQFHSFGLTVLTLMPLLAGAKSVYSARFVPARVLDLMRTHRPTLFIGIPSMFNAMLKVKNASPDDFASIRYLVSGGEPLPQETAKRFKERFGIVIAEGYGMTECSPVTNWCRTEEYRPRSVGMPLRGVDERIIDPATGRELPPGADGELRIKGPNVMRGYYNLPEQTEAAFDDRGYLKTGDMARFDADGHLFITGRIKEMLIVAGENVFPREIEEALESHSSVNAAGVVGLQDPVRGEVPVGFVEMVEDAVFDERALIAHCRDKLAGYKAPRQVICLDELPRNPTGKVLRRELSAELARRQTVQA